MGIGNVMPEDVCGSEENPNRINPLNYEMWKQARRELLGFANHLEKKNVDITAAQIRMCIARADLVDSFFSADDMNKEQRMEYLLKQWEGTLKKLAD